MKAMLSIAVVLLIAACVHAETKPAPVQARPAQDAVPTRIVHVCDASGSMQVSFDWVRKQLKEAIGSMVPKQSFNVLFFSSDEVYPFSKDGLLPATDKNKASLGQFVDDIAPRGSGEPADALKKAFESKPDVIFLMTDSFEDTKSVTEMRRQLAELNKDKKVLVHITFIASAGDAKDKELTKVLEETTKENGGVLHIVVR